MNLQKQYGPWAMITGATSGIGAELADQLAAKGLHLVLVARKQADLQRQADALSRKHGVQTQIIPADLATDQGLEAVKRTAVDIGLLVVSAGMEVNGAFEKTPIEQEIKLVQLNVMATLQLTHHFSKAMVQRGRGGLLLISSLSGHMPNPYFSNYAGSKAYVLNLGASLFGELGRKGVDVSVLSPGLTNTAMVADNGMDWQKMPMQSMDPADVAAQALDGLGKRFLTVPGRRNKLMAWMLKHSPTEMAARMTEKMVRKAIHPSKI
jgi:short-subunit dehydrogenase